jgi:hypothetical protein
MKHEKHQIFMQFKVNAVPLLTQETLGHTVLCISRKNKKKIPKLKKWSEESQNTGVKTVKSSFDWG